MSAWTLIGQDRAVSLLQRGLKADSLSHAYLFVGPAHVGKMTLALNLAQALNCEAAEPPCGQCVSCQKIASNRHADVQIVGLSQDGDSGEPKSKVEISIDQIRQLQHSASLPPFEGKCKVFILNGAELLSIEAANCLLKTLEEPVEKVVFMVLTTSERLLPATVVSRCQRLELRPLAIGEVEAALIERWDVEPQKAGLLARLSQGRLGWAVSALDGSLLQQRAECLDKWVDIVKGDCEERFTYAAQLAAKFGQDREVVQERLDLWLEWWRDLLLTKAGLTDAVTNIDRLLTIDDMARGYSLAQVRSFIDNIRVAVDQLKLNANPRLVLEILMLNIPDVQRHGERTSAAHVEVKYG